jgi:hypothetical protein
MWKGGGAGITRVRRRAASGRGRVRSTPVDASACANVCALASAQPASPPAGSASAAALPSRHMTRFIANSMSATQFVNSFKKGAHRR